MVRLTHIQKHPQRSQGPDQTQKQENMKGHVLEVVKGVANLHPQNTDKDQDLQDIMAKEDHRQIVIGDGLDPDPYLIQDMGTGNKDPGQGQSLGKEEGHINPDLDLDLE